ncbi:uncharacterized protein K489DRAFT_316615 [Dissoconium aciculare CBS 342.82]|uniref:Uncharacterized protein n=1 Tax=Dissoconium aciculare CBS 342.82 TaxID=1314786 RepID=A0A6J3MAW1_9PEZI|nr:uncharacterized protein K489DRAFT_316615 [Dissoconium aciculare CBS 342.82]KAF1823967.1 hypothetical protein K489DRAFT_316615 [Dissoconium aciculare CBS 342.82]
MAQYMQDELASLFHNMQVSGRFAQDLREPELRLPPQESPQQPFVTEMFPADEKLKQHFAPIHYASVHYTPTAHIRPGDSYSEPSRSPPPAYPEAIMPEDLADTLRQHSIDPSTLLPNQIQLFANAQYEQRLRLLELWRIAPPSYPVQALAHNMDTHLTSVELEEQRAKLRYEQRMQQSRPIAQQQDHRSNLSQAASDPVYAAAAPSGLWSAPAHHTNAQQLEAQYYDQIRNHADWERTNERMMQERLGRDDEMVM